MRVSVDGFDKTFLTERKGCTYEWPLGSTHQLHLKQPASAFPQTLPWHIPGIPLLGVSKPTENLALCCLGLALSTPAHRAASCVF